MAEEPLPQETLSLTLLAYSTLTNAQRYLH